MTQITIDKSGKEFLIEKSKKDAMMQQDHQQAASGGGVFSKAKAAMFGK
jgi:hypothetical protein